MSGRFLLDTNIVIALFADEAIVKDNLSQASEVFIPSIVIAIVRTVFTEKNKILDKKLPPFVRCRYEVKHPRGSHAAECLTEVGEQ